MPSPPPHRTTSSSTYTRPSSSRLARTMSSSAMEDLRAKNMACAGGGGETSSSARAAESRILAQWAARRWQACEQIVLGRLDRRDRDSELLALARLHAVSTMLDASSFLRARAHANDDDGGVGGRRARSPERALVPRIAREWTAPAQQQGSPRGGGHGGGEEWLGETERERVRSVRERVRRASQGDDHTPGLRRRQARAPDVARRMSMERLLELQGLSEHRAVSSFAHRGRIQSFLRGRFFRGGRPMHDDRPPSVATRELGQLTQSHHVARLREEVGSRTEDITNDQATNHSGSTDAQNSSADNEHFIDQVFRADNHHLENASGDHEIQSTEVQSANVESTVPDISDALQVDHFDQEHMHGYEEYSSDSGSSEQSSSSSSSPSDNSARQEAEAYVQPPNPTDVQWSREMVSGSEEAEEEWHVIDSPEAEAEWQPDLSRFARSAHNSLQEDELYGMYRVELRELLSRRSVSNLLSSGFRESLDQLIQSYAQRQEHDPPDWEIPATASSLNEDHVERGIDGSNRAEHGTTAQPSGVFSGQTVLPQQQAMHRPAEFELDYAIHDLRDDIAGLQRGMASTQQMLLACMEMQIELQRSIRQEVSAALHRSVSVQGAAGWMLDDDGSEWELVRKGTCCVCCDSQIDSLLYRCGHMCTCAKCAGELLRGVGKCPLCHAPIVEVIRAYSII